MNFEQILKEEVGKIRERLQSIEDMSEFSFDIEVRGRVHDGDVKIEFVLGPRYGESTRGGTLQAVLDECIRRYRWNKINAPICIGAVPKDEIPF